MMVRKIRAFAAVVSLVCFLTPSLVHAACSGCVIESYLDEDGNRSKRCDGADKTATGGANNACSGKSNEYNCTTCTEGADDDGSIKCYCSLTL
jgi:hypothetical protein